MTQLTAGKRNLRRLAMARLLVLAGLGAGLVYAGTRLALALHYDWLTAVLALLGALTAATFWRLRQSWPVTDPEYFGQLLLDVGGFGVLLYFSGGATNPFVSYLLVPLSIAAAILPLRYVLILAVAAVGEYSALLFFYEPLALFMPGGSLHTHQPLQFPMPAPPLPSPHIVGMWCTFTVSAALITTAVTRIAATVREQQAELNRHREEALHNEQLLAVATLAAGTAHELGTPLATMTLLLDDMHSGDPALDADIALLRQQVATCRTTLKGLVRTADSHRADESPALGIRAAVARLLERWQIVRPGADYRLLLMPQGDDPRIRFDEPLQQALLNLLNNAADTDSGPVDIAVSWDAERISLHIRDRGPGIAGAVADHLGKPFVTSKGHGLGLGLFLSHATIERHGGEVRLYNHPDGGTEAVLHLPRLPTPA